MRAILIPAALVVLFSATLAVAQSELPIYSDAQLREASKAYSANLGGVWNTDLIQKLSPARRASVAGVALNTPLRAQVRENNQLVFLNAPFTYFADSAALQVTIPILSIKFLDDISTATAWLAARNCAPALALDYVGMIGHQDPARQPTGRFPTPLAAFNIPDDVLKQDSVVYDDSGKLLKSGIYFMMAHELAHVLYQHPGSSPGPEGQAREILADAFAMEVMRDIGVPPAGTVMLFGGHIRYVDPASDTSVLSHPVSTRRLEAVAQYIKRNLTAFARLQSSPVSTMQVASDLEGIARNLDDVEWQKALRNRSLKTTVGQLAASCR